MEKPFNKIFIDAPASTSRKSFEFVNGEIITPASNDCDLEINIAFRIGGRSTITNACEWSTILKRKTPQSKPTTAFVITEEDWLTAGLTCVIPTPILQSTPVYQDIIRQELFARIRKHNKNYSLN